MDKYLSDKNKGNLPDLELLLLSAHDTSMSPFLKIFYPDMIKCIEDEYKRRYVDGEKMEKAGCLIDKMDFTANIILEMIERENKVYIRMNLNNEPQFIFGKEKS